LVEQNSRISFGVPGSWPPKSFEGNPRMTKPLSLSSWYIFSRPVYCFVLPHLLATLTKRATFPACSLRGAGWPSSDFVSSA
jgi:hypothetical protein